MDDTTIEDVLRFAGSQGLTPQDSSKLLDAWSAQQADKARSVLDTKDYFYLKANLDEAVNTQKDTLHAAARQNFLANDLPKLLPDVADRAGFAAIAEKGIPDDLALQTQVPANLVPAFKALRALDSDPSFSKAVTTSEIPVTAPSGGKPLANYVLSVNANKTAEAHVRLPGKDGKPGEDFNLSVAAITDKEYEDELAAAKATNNKAYEDARTTRQIEAGFFEKKFGIIGKTELEAERDYQAAADRLARLEDNGKEAGKSYMLIERAAKQIKESPIADKLGDSGVLALAEDFGRSVSQGFADIGIGLADAVRFQSGVNVLKDYKKALDNALPGATGTEYRAKFLPNLVRDFVVQGGNMIPTLLPSAGLARLEALGAGASRLAGLGAGIGAQTYGNRLVDMQNDADAMEAAGHPELAKQIRDNARAAALSDAVVEVATESIFREDQLMPAGSGGLLRRVVREGAKSVIENAVEETLAQLVQGGVNAPIFQGVDQGSASDVGYAALLGGLIGAPMGIVQGFQTPQEVQFAGARRDLMQANVTRLTREIETLQSSRQGDNDTELDDLVAERQQVLDLFKARKEFWDERLINLAGRQAKENGESNTNATNAAGGAALEADPAATLDTLNAKAKAAVEGTPAPTAEETPVPAEPEERPTRHRVFEGGGPLNVKPGEGVFDARDNTQAYRVTGQSQIDDMISSGLVRAKEGQMRGGRSGETQWSRGDARLGYQAKTNEGNYIIQTSADGLNDKQGGLPLDAVTGIFRSENGQWVDVTAEIKGESETVKTAANPTLPENLDADQEANFLFNKFPGLTRTDTVPEGLRTLATNLEQRTGAKTYFARGDKSQGGVSRPGGKAIIVNLDNPQSTRKLIGHEIRHTLEGDPAFDSVFELVKKNSRFNAYAAKLTDLGYTPEEIDSEFQADLFGELAGKRSFWREVQSNTPANVFQRLHDTVLDSIEELIRVLRNRFRGTGRSSASAVVDNLLQIRKALASTLAQRGELDLTEGERIRQSSTIRESRTVSPDDPPLKNLPGAVNVPGHGKRQFGPVRAAREAAIRYMERAGLPYNPPTEYAKVDPARAQRIAAEFDRMEHNPQDPRVKAAYDAMIRETLAQWEIIKETGLVVEPIKQGQEDPYKASPRLAQMDVEDNNHLWFFPTDFGFGNDVTGFDPKDNPLFEFTGEVLGDHKMRANDVFRIVHDYFGHFKEGVGFRADGEENAWRSHASMYSPEARGAMTTETRGQNSWLNFGPHGEKNRNAKVEDTVFADQKIGLMPEWTWYDGDGVSTTVVPREVPVRLSVSLPARFKDGKLAFSTRAPSGRNAVVPKGLIKADLAALDEDPAFKEKMAAEVKTYPQVVNARLKKPDSVIRELIDTMKGNLRFLWDLMPARFRDRSGKWYEGAHALANDIARVTGLTPQQVAGAFAVLSPQKDWFQNVSLAERTITIVLDANKSNPRFNEAMRDALVEFTRAANLREVGIMTADQIEATRSETSAMAENLLDKRWNELSTMDKAVFVRAADFVQHPRSYLNVMPEGDKGEIALTETGKIQKAAWGSYSEIAKAILIIDDGSPSNISEKLGKAHKVRNFFNNISDPNAEEDFVTIDTHAVAAALLEPLSGTSPQVSQLFSGAKRSTQSGLQGPYAIYAQAYTELAAELSQEVGRRVPARELQSVTWETIRLLFTRGQKRDTFQKSIETLWKRHKKGELTADALRTTIQQKAGGIGQPAWAPAQQELAFDEGTLSEGDVFSGVPGVPRSRGELGGDSGGTSRLNPGQPDGVVSTTPIRESRSVGPKKFRRVLNGQQTNDTFDRVESERLLSIANKFLPARSKPSDEKDALKLLKDLRERDPSTNLRVSNAVQKEFSDRLVGLTPEEKTRELTALRAMSLQVILGNAAAVARRFQLTKGEVNKKRAARLYNAIKETAYAATLQVAGDRYTAARILRSTQISADGSVSTIMFSMMDGLNQFLYRKTGVTREDIDAVESVKKSAKKGAAADAVAETTPAGQEITSLREKVKSKIRKVASWLGITSESRSNLPLAQTRLVNEIKSLLERIDIDYRGNIEELLEKLSEAVDNMSGATQVQALLDLRKAVRDDETLAKKEFEVLGDSLRKLDAAADRFISGNGDPNYRFGTNKESLILSKIRKDVRGNKITPEQGGDLFVQAKGDKLRRAAVVNALEADRNSTTQQAELEANAAQVEAWVADEVSTPEEDAAEAADDPAADVLALAERLMQRELSRAEFRGRRGTTEMQAANDLLRKFANADGTVSRTAVLAAYAAAGVTASPTLTQAVDVAEGARLLRRETLDSAARVRFLAKRDAAQASQDRAQRATAARAAERHAAEQEAAVTQAEGIAMKALGAVTQERPRTLRQEAAAARQRFVSGKTETEDSVRAAYERAGFDSETIDRIIPLLQVAREAAIAAREAKLERDDFTARQEQAKRGAKAQRDRAEAKSRSLVEQGQRLIDSALGVKKGKSQTKLTEANSLRNQYVNSKNGVTKAHVKQAFIDAGYEDNDAMSQMLDAAEAARLLRRDQAQAKAAARYNKRADAKEKAEADKVESVARNVFRPKTEAKVDPITGEKVRKITVEEDILNAINDNPEWDISNPADKALLIEEVLARRTDLTPEQRKAQAAKIVDRFNDKLGRILEKQAKRLAKRFERSKITENDLRQAIRLNLLDPSSSLATALAAHKGWRGLTDSELTELGKALDTAEEIHDSQVRLSILLRQMRIVQAATGVEPKTHEIISSAVRASAYSGAGSILINFTVPVIMGGIVTPLREMTLSLLSRPNRAPEIVRSSLRAMAHSVRNAVAAARIAAKYDATLGLSAAKDSAGPESVGVLAIDSLTRRMDMAIDRINDAAYPKYKKAWEYLMMAVTSQRILWKILGAADSAGIALIQEFLTEMKVNRDLRRNGQDPDLQWRAFMDTVVAGSRFGVDSLGLTPLQAQKEMMTRAREAYYNFLVAGKTGVDGFEIHQDARREALSIMGNHEEVQGTISLAGSKLADLIGSPKLLGLGSWLTGPVRIISQVVDMGVWMMPGWNIFRYVREARAQKKGEGRFAIHAGSEWQLQRRFHEVIAGNVIGLLLVALLSGQDDKDPWFEITGAYPLDAGEAARWQQNGIKEYTMYLGHRAGKRFQIQFTRGAFEFLTMPALFAKHVHGVISGKESPEGAFGTSIYDTVNVGIPAIQNMAKALGELREGDARDLYKELAFRGSTLIPFSGAQRSIAKVGDQPTKDDPLYLWSQWIPAVPIFTKETVSFKNALGENPFQSNSVWNTFAKLGLPLGFIEPSRPKDELLARDFSRMNYGVPPAPSLKTLQKDSPALTVDGYSKFIDVRAAAFKSLYREDPAPGDSAKDERNTSAILKAGDRAAYKKRMAALWSKATKQAKEELGLVPDDD